MKIHRKEFSTKRICVAISLLLPAAILAIIFHNEDRLRVQRLIYPLIAELSITQDRCSSNAPEWLRTVNRVAAREHGSPRNQIALIDANGITHHCENGWGNKPLSVTPPNARFRYASLTKIFTATEILDLIENDEIGFETRLIDVIPEASPFSDERIGLITIRHLLYHQSGFDRLKSKDPLFDIGKQSWCPSNLEKLRSLKLDFTPGDRVSYSNLAYCLLGAILEKKTKKEFRHLIEEKYKLSASGIKFIDGPYLPDEIKYDFRNSLLLGEDYWKSLDFASLSSSAGLSGSAVALAKQISKIDNAYTKLHGISLGLTCPPSTGNSCDKGNSPTYKESDETLSVIPIQGNLVGSASLAIIDNHGNIVVWLGGGSSLNPQSSGVQMIQYIYKQLAISEKLGRSINKATLSGNGDHHRPTSAL